VPRTEIACGYRGAVARYTIKIFTEPFGP
jgi:hypothetical protein